MGLQRLFSTTHQRVNPDIPTPLGCRAGTEPRHQCHFAASDRVTSSAFTGEDEKQR